MGLSHDGLRARAGKLATAANRLKGLSGLEAPFSLAFMTDRRRAPNPLLIGRVLPRGAAIILRDYDLPARAGLAAQLKSICAARGLYFFVGADASLADWIGADGIHMPSWFDGKGGIPPGLLRTASCHNAADLARAKKRGANIAFLAPVFPTQSHPNAAELGAEKFRTLAGRAELPVFALGGVNEMNAGQLAGSNVAGIAAIGAFLP